MLISSGCGTYPLPLRERVAAQRPGEGFFFWQSVGYRHRYTLWILQNIVVPKPKRAKALRGEPGISLCVACGVRVLPAISLNDEARFEAHEIRNIWPNGHPPAELRPLELPVAQDAPQPVLCVSHVVAEVSRTVKTRRVCGLPLTRRPALPAATLSRKGRGSLRLPHRAISQVVSISPVAGFFASFKAIPMAASSSRMRSASAQFFAFRAASRASIRAPIAPSSTALSLGSVSGLSSPSSSQRLPFVLWAHLMDHHDSERRVKVIH